MDGLSFDRLCRTPQSEAYLISQDGVSFARVDLHFTQSIVYGVVVLERDLEPDEITDLIGDIDDDLVWSADVPRDDFVVTVYRGSEVGVFSDALMDDDEEDDEANGVG
ncbi:MAG: hypothetical protein U0821_02870 [Chloroflexota bacterium]